MRRLAYRSSAARHHRQPIAKAALDRQGRRATEIATRETAGRSAARAWREAAARLPARSHPLASPASSAIAASAGGATGAVIASSIVMPCWASTSAGKRHRWRRASAGAPRSTRPPRTQRQNREAPRDPPPPTAGRPPPRGRRRRRRDSARHASRVGIGSASASRASIMPPRSRRSSSPPRSRRERFGDLVAAVRALHHLAPPLQPDQRERRLRHRLARAREFVIERVQREQRLAPVGGANSAVRNRSGSCRGQHRSPSARAQP